jgi:hypothetical protein
LISSPMARPGRLASNNTAPIRFMEAFPLP